VTLILTSIPEQAEKKDKTANSAKTKKQGTSLPLSRFSF
jgi:hypothetical protein